MMARMQHTKYMCRLHVLIAYIPLTCGCTVRVM